MEDLTTLDEQTVETNLAGNQTPTFLKVLCILSWIASGLGVIGGLFGLVSASRPLEDRVEELEEAIYQAEAVFGEDSMLVELSRMGLEAAPYALINTLIGIAVAILSGIFVYMMFKLKKTGFHLYSALHVLMLFTPLLFVSPSGGLWLSMGINAFFTFLFVLLYGLNVKYMR